VRNPVTVAGHRNRLRQHLREHPVAQRILLRILNTAPESHLVSYLEGARCYSFEMPVSGIEQMLSSAIAVVSSPNGASELLSIVVPRTAKMPKGAHASLYVQEIKRLITASPKVQEQMSQLLTFEIIPPTGELAVSRWVHCRQIWLDSEHPDKDAVADCLQLAIDLVGVFDMDPSDVRIKILGE
jgi:hypothetical protein